MGKKKKKHSSLLNFLNNRIDIPKQWINKFTISGSLFLVWLTFFDSHSLITNNKVKNNVNRLKQEKVEHINKIAEAKQHKIDLENNKEKFARETYYMHKADEEIFIIEKKK
jgi:hypothetical protein